MDEQFGSTRILACGCESHTSSVWAQGGLGGECVGTRGGGGNVSNRRGKLLRPQPSHASIATSQSNNENTRGEGWRFGGRLGMFDVPLRRQAPSAAVRLAKTNFAKCLEFHSFFGKIRPHKNRSKMIKIDEN